MTESGFPTYYWRHKQPFAAWFCAEADASAFLAIQEDYEELAADGTEPEPDITYENLGHYHCVADDCPDGGDKIVIGAGSPETSALTHCPTCGAPEWHQDGRRGWNPVDVECEDCTAVDEDTEDEEDH